MKKFLMSVGIGVLFVLVALVVATVFFLLLYLLAGMIEMVDSQYGTHILSAVRRLLPG